MKKYFVISILFSTFFLYAQEANIWYFGTHAGLDFNSGAPIALTDGQLDTKEGCATISDASGQLLFYTDGITVYNKLHQIMPNGTGLTGHTSSAQSATIVQKPGSATLFYIFTTDNEHNPNGFRYSVVDMSLAGGLGEVTGEKNVLIFTPSIENIGVAKHANNIDYWVVGHGWDSNNFYAYQLTALGLSAIPITSSVGATITGIGFKAAGMIKISPSGAKLAFTSVSDIAQLFDFDDNTGIVSNPVTLSTETGELYGIEFSPNENVLYLTNAFNRVYQFDLTAADIANSKLELYNGNKFPAALQIAPDGKIYLAVYDQLKLGVINNPDVVGTGCGFQIDGLDLGGKVSQGGLPSFNRSFFNASFTVDNLCFGDTTSFQLTNAQNFISVNWDFGDGSPPSSLMNPTHQYAATGDYLVTLTATSTSGSVTKSRNISITSSPAVAATIANQLICGQTGDGYDLTQHDNQLLGGQSPSTVGVAYFATTTDANLNINALLGSVSLASGNNNIIGKLYSLQNPACYNLTSFTVILTQKPSVGTVQDNMLCDDILNDGIGTFNLTQNDSSVLGAQSPLQFSVNYYASQADADSDLNRLPPNYQNQQNPQTIYVRVSNLQNLSCFATSSFQIGLYAMPSANALPDLYACDDNADSVEPFNLGAQTSVVLGSQAASLLNVSYHVSLADAAAGVNPLADIFTNSINPQVIYVRVENAAHPECYATTSFSLHVMARPALDMADSYTICQGHPIVIAAPLGFDSYQWSDGSTGNTITVSTGGNYSLTVTRDYGNIACSAGDNFVVYESSIATITSVEIRDWTNNQNGVTVFVDGLGDYEYSIDGGQFQDSNVFENLASGPHTVYVRDKKECGTVDEEVFLLVYPKFFTPNGDGINDVWQIDFSYVEPNMQIQIFDRYGKFVKNFTGANFGWDGTLNGEPLFADDYWFVVTRENGKTHKGHFSLKR